MGRIGNIKDIYSQDTFDAQGQMNQAEAAKPGKYQSQYSDTMNNLLNQILDRKDFSYDFNADPLYQQYKDQYTQLGKNAMLDTAANASTLTGGFGNSYATTAAAQANQQYLRQLNGVIPELYGLALDKYQMDTQNMYNQLSAVGAQEDRNYGQYRDTVADYQSDRGYYYNKFAGSVANDQYVSSYNQTEDEYERVQNRWSEDMAYQKERAAVADAQWGQQFQYQQQRDAIEDSRWGQQFQYQQSRDAVSDDQWAKEYALSMARSRSAGGGGGGSTVKSTPADPVKAANYTATLKEAQNIKSTDGMEAAENYLVDLVNKYKIKQATMNSMLATLYNYEQ